MAAAVGCNLIKCNNCARYNLRLSFAVWHLGSAQAERSEVCLWTKLSAACKACCSLLLHDICVFQLLCQHEADSVHNGRRV